LPRLRLSPVLPGSREQVELTGTLALNTGIVVLTYRVPVRPARESE